MKIPKKIKKEVEEKKTSIEEKKTISNKTVESNKKTPIGYLSENGIIDWTRLKEHLDTKYNG